MPTGRETHLSRRAFLVASAGLVAAAACGDGSGENDEAGQSGSTTTSPDQSLNLVLGSFQTLSGSEQRIAFGVLDGQRPVAADADVSIAFGPAGAQPGEFVPLSRHAEGIEERPLHIARHTFATPGTYEATARLGKRTSTAAIQVVDPAMSPIPVPGQSLMRVGTPTVADAAGVNPICTRTPACPWHDVSLDTALDEAQPIVLLIATPALCQSQVCGPVLDILLSLEETSPGVRFLHAEVFTDNTGETTTPVVRAFKLENEPFLFFADSNGTITERIEGPFDRSEARSAIDRLRV